MTSRRNLGDQLRSIGEIRSIMNSMKTITYMETLKLNRLLDTQRAVVSGIEAVAADFITAHPGVLPQTRPDREVCLLIGSERGFCGDFSETLLHHLEHIREFQPLRDAPALIVAGHKLHARLERDPRVVAFLNGVSVAEEVETILARVTGELAALQAGHGTLGFSVLYHAGNDGGIVLRKLIPPFHGYADKPVKFPSPPVLNLTPPEFLIELSDHYIYAVLHEIFYDSLLAENQRRIRHLEGAVRHLDDRSARLNRQFNARRQQDIIEEIEVILLSADSLRKPSAMDRDR